MWKSASVTSERITTTRKPAKIAQALCLRRRGGAVVVGVEGMRGSRATEIKGAVIVQKGPRLEKRNREAAAFAEDAPIQVL